MSNALILDSLRRRMRAMHSLYEDACATMNLDQVNHVERDAVLPIAFSLNSRRSTGGHSWISMKGPIILSA